MRPCAGSLAKTFRTLATSSLIVLIVAHTASATSSTTFWTPMTPDIQPFGVLHLGIDNYFRAGHDSPGTLPTDFTLPTMGVLPFKTIQMEAGVDYFAGTAHPWLFNAKFGSPEDAWFKGSPALQVGVFNAARKFKTNRVDSNILFGVIGKTMGRIGRFSAGPYWGNHATLVSSTGQADNVGFMAAFDRGFLSSQGTDGAEYKRFVFAMDYASGRNALGGGGGGLYYFITKDISILAGPAFFNDRGINGKWKMTVQIDVNVSLLKLFAKISR